MWWQAYKTWNNIVISNDLQQYESAEKEKWWAQFVIAVLGLTYFVFMTSELFGAILDTFELRLLKDIWFLKFDFTKSSL